MRRLPALVCCSLLFLLTSCPEHDQLLSPRDYSHEFAARLREKLPAARIIVKADLELSIIEGAGKDRTAYLDNSYKEYRTSPQDKDAIITRYIAGLSEASVMHDTIDRTRITPVIKDKAWLAEIRESMRARGTKEEDIAENVSEPLNDQLVIVYAADSPSNLRYLSPKDLETAGVRKDELRALAVQNLKKIIPPIKSGGGAGLYMLVAGGDYEASLLLFDDIWKAGDLKVKGDYVVAVPSRDVLMVTGSEETEVITKLRQQVRKIAQDAPYRITTDLFVYRNGHFVKFED